MAQKTTIRSAYTLDIPGQYLGEVGDWHKFLMYADEMLELHAGIGESLGLTTFKQATINGVPLQEVAQALVAADSILSLLYHRGLRDTNNNRDDVAKACNAVARLRKWYEPLLPPPGCTTE